MSKFLNLMEEFDPNGGSDKWGLIEYLKSKGVQVSQVRDTDMLYIDDGQKTYPIQMVSDMPEEDAQTVMRSGPDEYSVDDNVEELAGKAAKGMKGLAGKVLQRPAQQASSAVKRRGNLAGKAVKTYDKKTREMEKQLRSL